MSELKQDVIIKYNRLIREVCNYYKLDVRGLYYSNGGLHIVTPTMLGCPTLQNILTYSKKKYPYLAPFIILYHTRDLTTANQSLQAINKVIKKIRKKKV